MSIAPRLRQHLDREGVGFDTVRHPRTSTASETAQAAHVPGDTVAKTVVIHHEEGYLLAVVPATHRVDLATVQGLVERRLGLASEREIDRLFADCASGAVPPVGAAYDVPVLLDESLTGLETVHFEGGDHQNLVRVSGSGFDRLMQGARRARFSHHV